MFTGIVESMGTIVGIEASGSNKEIWLQSNFISELKIDQSVAHNGICLTVTDIKANEYSVVAVAETIEKTNLGKWAIGDRLNLERCLRLGDRLDGHLVQGHVDTASTCTKVETLEGSWLYTFHLPKAFASLIIEKGSICINGVSLTSFGVEEESFMVTIIPYTFNHTNFKMMKAGDLVNLEFDILGKYLLRQQQIGS